MATDELHIIAQWPQLVDDRVDQRLGVAAWKISAAHGASENHIADLGDARGPIEEDDMSGRMPGGMEDLPFAVPDRQPVALVEPTRRIKGPNVLGKAIHAGLFGQVGNQKGVFAMGPDNGQACLVGHVGGPAGMVKVPMGQPDGFQFEPLLANSGQNGVH